MFTDRTWYAEATVPLELPIGLKHLDSYDCWCDPIIDVGDDGKEVVLHKQVTWH